jgi:antitoxin (DNA-binding transcriptional repressor) of toxin-antitoxin stability system
MKKKTTARELHLRTSGILGEVVNGETYIIERRGVPVAEIRPLSRNVSTKRLPNREKFLQKLPMVHMDSGRILEEDRI